MSRPYEAHFRRRARERFGLRVTSSRYEAWCRKIAMVAHGVTPLQRDERTSPGRSQWKAVLGGRTMRVVFDDALEQLVTCMLYADTKPNEVPRDTKARLARLRRR